MRQVKKLLALVLVLATVCSTLSVTAWASDVEEIDDPDAIVGEEISEEDENLASPSGGGGAAEGGDGEGGDEQISETPSQSDAEASDSSPIGGAKAEDETSDTTAVGSGDLDAPDDEEDLAFVGDGVLDVPEEEDKETDVTPETGDETPSAPAKAPAKAASNIVDSGTYGDLKWTLDSNGTLTVSGTGSMLNEGATVSPAPWKEQRDSIKSIVIQRGVTSIGDEAFSRCRNLASVTIPNSVISIGHNAFFYCNRLADITIPSSVTDICGGAFSYTPWLYAQGDFVIVNGILLAYLGSESAVIVPNNVTSIGELAFCDPGFRDSVKLTSIIIPDSVTSIGDFAFCYCDHLESVKMSDNLTSIGDGAFYCCERLTGVVITNGVTSIGTSAFLGCNSLNSITIPKSVATIGTYALGFGMYEVPSRTDSQNGTGITVTGKKAGLIDGFTIYGYTGSAAETYAKENNITFKSLGTAKLPTPALPTLKTASNGVIINWSKVSGAEKYRVFRKTGNGSWQKLGDTTGTSWTDRTAEKGKTYSYTICCVSKDGKTETSDYNKTGKSVTLYLATPAITSLQSASGGVIINWGKVSGAAKYRVFRRVGSGNWERVADVTDTRAVDRTAKKGTTYTYTVRCISSDSKTYTSDFNKTGKSIKYGTAEPTNLKAPTITSLQNASGGIIINWGKVSGATKYRVFRRVGNGSWERVADVTATRAVDRTAKKGVTYTYTVRCISSDSKTYTSSFNSTGWAIKR